MGSLIAFPGFHTPSDWTLPAVFTPARIECMGRANDVARRLRRLGYQLVAEDPFPDDGGNPIIEVDVSEMGTHMISHMGECAVRDLLRGVERIAINGVRVFWRIAHEDA